MARREQEIVVSTGAGGLGAIAQPQPHPIEYRASELLEDVRAKIERELGKDRAAVKWDIQPSDAVLKVDPQLFQEALLELFMNAFRHERDTAASAGRFRSQRERAARMRVTAR